MHPFVLWSCGSFPVHFKKRLSLHFQVVWGDLERGGRSRFTHLSLIKKFPLLPILRDHKLLSKVQAVLDFAWSQCAPARKVRTIYTHTVPGSFKQWNGHVFHVFPSYVHKCLYTYLLRFEGVHDTNVSFFLLVWFLLFPKAKHRLKMTRGVRVFSKLVWKGLMRESLFQKWVWSIFYVPMWKISYDQNRNGDFKLL